ncbi:hypothetical protein D3C73_1079560 [compost metagenome]
MVEVGVFQNDGRRFAAQFQGHRHHLVGGDVGNVFAGFGAAGERYALDQRVTGQRIAEQRTLARQYAEQALGQPGVFADACQLQGHQRSDFRRLDHYGVASRQRRSDFLRFAGDGRVPWRDRGDHAHRFKDAHADEITARWRDGFFERFTGRSEELKSTGGTGHQGTGFVDRLAIVLALQLRQFFAALTDQFGDAVQHAGAFMGFALRPAAVQKRLVGALHGFFHVFDTGGVEPGNGFTGGGVAGGVALTPAESPLAGNANG